jgi:hypothetical protein
MFLLDGERVRVADSVPGPCADLREAGRQPVADCVRLEARVESYAAQFNHHNGADATAIRQVTPTLANLLARLNWNPQNSALTDNLPHVPSQRMLHRPASVTSAVKGRGV